MSPPAACRTPTHLQRGAGQDRWVPTDIDLSTTMVAEGVVVAMATSARCRRGSDPIRCRPHLHPQAPPGCRLAVRHHSGNWWRTHAQRRDADLLLRRHLRGVLISAIMDPRRVTFMVNDLLILGPNARSTTATTTKHGPPRGSSTACVGRRRRCCEVIKAGGPAHPSAHRRRRGPLPASMRRSAW